MYYNFINILKINLVNRKKNFRFKFNKTELSLIKCLIYLRVIKYIKYNYSNTIKSTNLFLNYHNNKPIFTYIQNMYKPSKQIFIPLQILIKISQKNNIFILSTSKGILTNKEAIKNKTGGIILLNLKN